jgi:hypothetical protein
VVFLIRFFQIVKKEEKMKKRRIPITEIPKIKSGDKLYYSAGTGEHHFEAHVTIEHVGTTGCTVRINEIVTKSALVMQSVGEGIVAGLNELKILISNEIEGT